MRILIFSINYSPEPIGVGPFSAGTAEALAAAGHDVRVLASKPYYPQWRVFEAYRRFGYQHTRDGRLEVIRCPSYVPAKPSGLRRILHYATFVLTAAFPAFSAALTYKPDLVLVVAPTLLPSPVAIAVARLSGGHSWLHIQDFEIEAAFATDLLKGDSLIGRTALAFQRWVVRGFDTVSTISAPMMAKLAGLGTQPDRIVEFRNWSEVDSIPVLTSPSPYRAEWDPLPPNIVLYSGNIARKQGVGIIAETARLLRERSDICFLVCGEGPQKEQLMAEASDLPNIRFETLQPKERLGDLLGLATVHILPQLADAADLVLPSKLANMLASGRPVVATAHPGTALQTEVEGCGIVTPPGDPAALARAITTLVDHPDQAGELGIAARRRAEERWSRAAIIARLLRDVEQRLAVRRGG